MTAGKTPASGTSLEVLIVEDDAVILNTLAYNLHRQGFITHKAPKNVQRFSYFPLFAGSLRVSRSALEPGT